MTGANPYTSRPSRAPAFRQHDSGLYVPEAISRRRQVLTRDEWKLYERAIRLYERHTIAVKMHCAARGCDDPAIVIVPGTDPILRCGCTDRVFTRAF